MAEFEMDSKKKAMTTIALNAISQNMNVNAKLIA